MEKHLALLLFISASVTAFCLAVVAYVYVVGELPLNARPVLHFDVSTPPPTPRQEEKNKMAMPDTPMRQEEVRLGNVYVELEKERQRWAERNLQLADRQRVVEELAAQATQLQEEVAKAESRVRNLLDIIEAKEVSNLRNLAATVSTLESADAASLLATMEQQKAARVLYFVDQKKVAQILAAMIRDGRPADAAAITERMHRLSEELPN